VKHPSKLDLGDYLPYLVNRVGTVIAEQFGGEALAPHGLSIAMWRVMAVLAANGSQRQIDLADLTSIDASKLPCSFPPRGARLSTVSSRWRANMKPTPLPACRVKSS
jgi:hypothetical protein